MKHSMGRIGLIAALASLFLYCGAALRAQEGGTAPTFHYTSGQRSLTLAGRDPAQGGTTVIPTLLVPVRLHFDSSPSGQPVDLDAAPDVAKILHSPVFSKAKFVNDDGTQYVDAMLRATTGTTGGWHTMLGQPEVRPVVTVEIPPEDGYVLTSKRTGTQMAIVDARYVQRAIFKQIPRQDGKLVISVTQNTAFGSSSWGTHGVDEATGNSFVLAEALRHSTPERVLYGYFGSHTETT